ncbi:MAG TPA: efflux transporter outer membrane subunit [Bryobacteraceae bacterium]|nr:efflux transporter outer membrane subunit [Bryobacteraceae bacterium]
MNYPTDRKTASRAWTVVVLALSTTACSIGPKYSRPPAAVPSTFKEQPPPEFKEMKGWKVGQPIDGAIRGKWWQIFGDPQLNELEEQVNINSNQTLAQAEAQFRGAQAAIRATHAGLFPTIGTSPLISESKQSSNRTFAGRGFPTAAVSDFEIPFSVSYEPDFWGRVRLSIESNLAAAQASAADLETGRLSIQATLAQDYFQLRGLDAQQQLLNSTVADYQRALDLTVNRYKQGVASQIDVAQAQTILEQTRAQATDTGVLRSQFEHAIAILIGRPPSEFSLPVAPITIQPPPVPFGIPSELLERRPDIAGSERRVAAANAQIGIALTAFYPTLTLSGSAGLESTALTTLVQWPSRLWSVGATLAQTLFDAGRRRALTDEAKANYDATVAIYRQTVLTAFQDVEDNLAAVRILEEEARLQDAAVKSAQRSLELAINQYKGGITTYLQVITAQEAALAGEVSAVNILTRRMTASVLLVKALGGGWTDANLPTSQDLMAKKAAPQATRQHAPAINPGAP